MLKNSPAHTIPLGQDGEHMYTCVYLWRIHFDIWQNQYNIVKLKNKIKLKKIKSTTSSQKKKKKKKKKPNSPAFCFTGVEFYFFPLLQ